MRTNPVLPSALRAPYIVDIDRAAAPTQGLHFITCGAGTSGDSAPENGIQLSPARGSPESVPAGSTRANDDADHHDIVGRYCLDPHRSWYPQLSPQKNVLLHLTSPRAAQRTNDDLATKDFRPTWSLCGKCRTQRRPASRPARQRRTGDDGSMYDW